MWKAAVAAAAIACGVQSACSPYVFSENVRALSTKMASIDASYQDNARKIVDERHLGNRTLWVHEKPVLLTGPGCDFDATNSIPGDLVAQGTPAPAVHVAAKPEPTAPSANVCETITDLPSAPTTDTDKHPPPLQRADLLRALDNYTGALAAITKAQDRADFDNAAALAVHADHDLVPFQGAGEIAARELAAPSLRWGKLWSVLKISGRP